MKESLRKERLRIAGPEDSLPLFITKLSLGFAKEHPDIGLSLINLGRPIDFAVDDFDAGLRRGYVVQNDVMGVWLSPPERFVVVGTPQLFKKYGHPSRPEDLMALPCVLHRRSGIVDPWEFSIDGKRVTVNVRGYVTTDDIVGCLMAALSGGAAYLPWSLVAEYVRSGELEAPLGSCAVEEPGLTIYFPQETRALPKLRALIDFAARHFESGSASMGFKPFRWPFSDP